MFVAFAKLAIDNIIYHPLVKSQYHDISFC